MRESAANSTFSPKKSFADNVLTGILRDLAERFFESTANDGDTDLLVVVLSRNWLDSDEAIGDGSQPAVHAAHAVGPTRGMQGTEDRRHARGHRHALLL